MHTKDLIEARYFHIESNSELRSAKNKAHFQSESCRLVSDFFRIDGGLNSEVSSFLNRIPYMIRFSIKWIEVTTFRSQLSCLINSDSN